MLSHCLDCRKNTERKTQNLQGKKMKDKCFFLNVQCVIVKNRSLLKSTKL